MAPEAKCKRTPAELSPRAAFGYPNFRFYLSARLLTTAASEMQSVAVGWQLYAITHRPLDLGLGRVSAQFLPGICLFLFAGHIADRLQRQRILQSCMLAFTVCSALLFLFALRHGSAFNPTYRPYPIYGILLLNGAVRAFSAPANSAFLPLLVPRAVFPNAVAWTSSAFQSATHRRPDDWRTFSMGLRRVRNMSMSAPLAATLCSFLLMSGLKLAPWEHPKTAFSMNLVLDGLRFIKDTKLVLGAISLDLFAVLLGGATALLPVYARGILNVGRDGFGFDAQRAGSGSGADERVVGPLSSAAQGRRDDVVVRVCVRLFHGGVWTFAQLSSFACAVVSHWGV